MERLKVGFIGLGRIADLHFAGYAKQRDARLYALCDADPDLLGARKKSWKAAKAFASIDEMLADPELDAVEILTPQKLHEPMAIAALKAGKHVALQKPMTINLKSADRIGHAAKQSGRIFRVTDNYCFYPPILLARKMIDEGEIGDPTHFRIRLTAGSSGGWDVPLASWQWRLREKEEGRGMQTFDHGHHLFAAAWYLMGTSERVFSWIDSVDGMIDSPATVAMKFSRSGAHGVIDFSYGTELTVPSDYYANDEVIEITGSRGLIVIHRCTGKLSSGPALSLYSGKKWKHISSVKSDWQEGFTGAVRNFIDSVRGTDRPRLAFQDARHILALSLAVQRSAKIGREVFISEMDSPVPTFRYLGERFASRGGFSSFFSGITGGSSPLLAAEAPRLTADLLNRFDAKAAGSWNCTVRLELSDPAYILTLNIAHGSARLAEGSQGQADLVLSVSAETWGAILSGKKRIDVAFLQGKLKIKGKTDEALKLRSVFGL